MPRKIVCFEGDLNEKGLKRASNDTLVVVPRFEGDLNEKGLKPPRWAGSRCPGFEGDLNEKGLKLPRIPIRKSLRF